MLLPDHVEGLDNLAKCALPKQSLDSIYRKHSSDLFSVSYMMGSYIVFRHAALG